MHNLWLLKMRLLNKEPFPDQKMIRGLNPLRVQKDSTLRGTFCKSGSVATEKPSNGFNSIAWFQEAGVRSKIVSDSNIHRLAAFRSTVEVMLVDGVLTREEKRLNHPPLILFEP